MLIYRRSAFLFDVKWSNLLQTHLTEKTPIYSDAVRIMFVDDMAKGLITRTGRKNSSRIELRDAQIERIRKLLLGRFYTTIAELTRCVVEFGSFRPVVVSTIKEKRVRGKNNVSKYFKGLYDAGWLDKIGIEYMTYASAVREKGVPDNLELHPQTKIFVNSNWNARCASPNLTE
jgi:hypothetical protein